ncbi:histidine kinase [Pseudonocardia dioxanivorans CB1190]|uniref:histidine kinase n=1 Tax=Pseudonocardia dioxanivorans (strain ATCC 55486 / DSM 44775 / JCM 13855 / CB1190) TaxID=675635 RepID=F4CRB7_PSEUX|nr:histidine kinase [Pseudonocardia dioxanivorans]AEA25208.1 histidine kinase [Pseudonocardia dioxanivorans CB1190]
MDERENDPTRPVREHHAGHELHPFRMTGGTLGRNVPTRPPAHLAASRSELLTAPAAPTWAPPTTVLPTGVAWTTQPPVPPAAPQPAPRSPRGPTARTWLLAGYWLLLAACALFSVVWLVVGAVVGFAASSPAFAASLTASAANGGTWAQGILGALGHSEPGAQALLDYALSLASILLGVVMAVRRGRSWSARLLVLALVGSAGAFNLQAHAAASAVETATGLAIGGVHQILLHGVACAAYILALLIFPPGADEASADGAGIRRPGAVPVVVATVTLLLAGFGTALLPHTASCVLFFGFAVPAAGLLALPRRVRHSSTDDQRTQARLLFSVLLAAGAIAVVLAGVSLLVWGIGWGGLALMDPTAGGSGDLPLALLFWFSRLACVAIAGAVLIALRTGGLQNAERWFSRGLVVALDTAVIGGGYVLVHTVVALLVGGPGATLWSAVAACTVAAVAFLPVHVAAERIVDRLLYGTRPTPYSVLAGIAALSRSTAADAPDLARVAEAVGRGLGATTCRLTVVRPGLRDRTYSWAEPGVHVADDLTEVAVRHGEERIGTIAVDRAAVAGLGAQRQSLLTDIADSLGAVLQASRYGIELERQLRAALAHAGEIAVSRRAAVAEMDGERRRIERDLHDGAQHHLVSLRLSLGLVEHLVKAGKFDQARERLDQVVEQIRTAESILAETATGVVSPLLSEHGLVGGLATELGGGSPPVAVEAPGLAGVRFPADVEAAVWFCCLEGVNNARKYAGGAPVVVRLAVQGGSLRFLVRDEGPGFDQTAAQGGANRGMRNLVARISSVGGRIEVRSRPGEGTTVEGSVPVPSHHEETIPIDAVQAAAWRAGSASSPPRTEPRTSRVGGAAAGAAAAAGAVGRAATRGADAGPSGTERGGATAPVDPSAAVGSGVTGSGVAAGPTDSGVAGSGVAGTADAPAAASERPSSESAEPATGPPAGERTRAGAGAGPAPAGGMWRSRPPEEEPAALTGGDLTGAADDLEWFDPRAVAAAPRSDTTTEDPGFGAGFVDGGPARRHVRDEAPQDPEESAAFVAGQEVSPGGQVHRVAGDAAPEEAPDPGGAPDAHDGTAAEVESIDDGTAPVAPVIGDAAVAETVAAEPTAAAPGVEEPAVAAGPGEGRAAVEPDDVRAGAAGSAVVAGSGDARPWDEPVAAEPVAAGPVAAEPGLAEQGAAESAVPIASGDEPGVAEPGVAEPGVAEPGPAGSFASESFGAGSVVRPGSGDEFAPVGSGAAQVAAEQVAAEQVAAEQVVAEQVVAEPDLAEPVGVGSAVPATPGGEPGDLAGGEFAPGGFGAQAPEGAPDTVRVAPDAETTGPIPVVTATPGEADASTATATSPTGIPAVGAVAAAPPHPTTPAEPPVAQPTGAFPAAAPHPQSSPSGPAPSVQGAAPGLVRGTSGPAGAGTLRDRVRGALALAAELYRETPHATRIVALYGRLDEPLRIAFAGPAGVGTSTLVEAVLGHPGAPAPPPPTRAPVWWRHGAPAAVGVHTDGTGAPYGGPWPPDAATAAALDRIELHVPHPLLGSATILDLPGVDAPDGRGAGLLGPDEPVADALVLLLRPDHPEDAAAFAMLHTGVVPHARANALGVLARADETPGGLDPDTGARVAAELASRSDVRRLARTVVPVSGLLARAAPTLSPADVEALARGAAVDPALAARLGPSGLGAAAAMARTAPDPASVVAGLLARSGIDRFRDLVATRFVSRSDVLVARSVLQRLEIMVRTTPPPAGARPLQYELERVRAGAHELAETDLLDQLLAGTLVMPPAELLAAERLLGMNGTAPAARLDLDPDADDAAVAAAAADRLQYWQRAAAHPASPQSVRAVAAVLVRTCERLLAVSAR